MEHITVEAITPGSPDENLPADVVSIQATAEQARVILTTGPLPRYAEVTALCEELGGMLRVMIDDIDKRIPDQRRKAVAPLLAEVDYRLDISLGSGLQSAVDHTAALASILITLCHIHNEDIPKPPGPGTL
jgi:hypothetical protein